MNDKLPPDPENKNHDRAEWTAVALRAFEAVTGADYDHEALSDLLCDLMHWSDRNDVNFEAALDRGRMHHEAETEPMDAEAET
jgi:hypothetical protein